MMGNHKVVAGHQPNFFPWLGFFAKIACSDNGVGINDSDLEKIFEPMLTTKAGGTGFGLAVCKEIVERHGGTIDVTPGNNGAKGTIFTVNLPIPV